MAQEEKKAPSLPERLREQLEGYLGRLRDAAAELFAPPPEPVRIPVRIPVRGRGYRR